MDPVAAQTRATAQWDAQLEGELVTLRGFEQALASATGTLAALDDDARRAAGRIVEAVQQGHEVDAVAVHYGLDDRTAAALAAYAAAQGAGLIASPWAEYPPAA